MEKDKCFEPSNLIILISKVIFMTILTNTNNRSSAPLTYKDYMKLRREKIRDRRLRTGSLISGQILSLTPSDNLIELYRTEPDMAI